MENKKSISLIYISNRYGGLDILKSSLKRQLYQDDLELVFVDGLYEERKDIVKSYFEELTDSFTNFTLKHLPDVEMDAENGYKCKLARCDNKAFKNCTNTLIVSVQDYIYIPAYGLERFYNLHLEKPNSLLTGISHQYYYPSKEDIKDEKGLITIYGKEYTDRPEVLCWRDPRQSLYNGVEVVRKAYPIEWELNWAAVPYSIIKELGGMDEEYDRHGFGYDNTNIATRADMLGYEVYLDNQNEVYCVSHDKYWNNYYKDNDILPSHFHNQRMRDIQAGRFPVRLNNL